MNCRTLSGSTVHGARLSNSSWAAYREDRLMRRPSVAILVATLTVGCMSISEHEPVTIGEPFLPDLRLQVAQEVVKQASESGFRDKIRAALPDASLRGLDVNWGRISIAEETHVYVRCSYQRPVWADSGERILAICKARLLALVEELAQRHASG